MICAEHRFTLCGFWCTGRHYSADCQDKGTLAQPIVVGGRRRVSDIVRMFMREKYHLIYLLDEYGMIRKVIPEQRVLETYFDETKRGSPMEELFL